MSAAASVEPTTVAEVTTSETLPEAVAQPVPASVAAGKKSGRKGKAKGKGKAKAKGKAKSAFRGAKGKKAKGKGKAKAKPKAVEGEGACEAKAKKAKAPQNFKAQLMQQVGDRDMDVVLKEVLAEVEALEKEIQTAQSDAHAVALAKAVDDTRAAMDQASADVKEAMQREQEALEKLKELKLARASSASGAQKAEDEKLEVGNLLAMLDHTLANDVKVKELEEAKTKAAEAKEAAKKAFEESKEKEREAQAIFKKTMLDQREQESEALRKHMEANNVDMGGRKDQKKADKIAQKEVASEFASLLKERTQREKERQSNFNVAAGLAKIRRARGTLALNDGSAVEGDAVMAA